MRRETFFFGGGFWCRSPKATAAATASEMETASLTSKEVNFDVFFPRSDSARESDEVAIVAFVASAAAAVFKRGEWRSNLSVVAAIGGGVDSTIIDLREREERLIFGTQ